MDQKFPTKKVILIVLSSAIFYILSLKFISRGGVIDQAEVIGILTASFIPFFIFGLMKEDYRSKFKLLSIAILSSVMVVSICDLVINIQESMNGETFFLRNFSTIDFLSELATLGTFFIIIAITSYYFGKSMRLTAAKTSWLVVVIILCFLAYYSFQFLR
jgi:hypothetical protein